MQLADTGNTAGVGPFTLGERYRMPIKDYGVVLDAAQELMDAGKRVRAVYTEALTVDVSLRILTRVKADLRTVLSVIEYLETELKGGMQ